MKYVKEKMHKGIAMLLALAMVVSLGVTVQASAYEQKIGKVKATTLYVREGPGTGYDKMGYVRQNSMVTIVDEANASDGALWYKIKFEGSYGYVSASFVELVPVDTGDTDFESTINQFPESYRSSLRAIHALYPNWVFKPLFTHTNWADALAAESKLGHSLVHKNTISSWKSTAPGAYDWSTGTWVGFDGPSWVQASDEILAYYMDPRSYLDSNYVFAFLDYSYDASQTREGLANIVKGTFLKGGFTQDGTEYSYVDVIMDAASRYSMNPYVLATIMRNELGVNGSKSISGTVPGYEGYYNYYNIGAYATSTMTAIQRGLWYAKGGNDGSTSYNRPWNNRYDAILGGANFYASNYVGHGQNTVYLKKFNVVGSDRYPPYTHEYMTNVTGASSEGFTLSKAYGESARAEKLIFQIPVFNNMPETPSKKPTGDGSPNNKLASLTANQGELTPAFHMDTQSYDLVLNPGTTEFTLSATALDAKATIRGTGTYQLKEDGNDISVTVTAQNGQKRVYTVHAVVDPTGTGKKGEWKKNDTGWWYEYPDGSFEVDCWAEIEGVWYHFDAKGYMQTGWLEVDSQRYYLEPNGHMVTGWKQIDECWYYFGDNGSMQTDWQNIKGYWYYFSPSGDMQIGWQEIEDKRYYFAPSGYMATGWQEIEGERYYFASGGAMQVGWQEIDGKRYYFYENGAMAKDVWIDGQYVDGSGALVEKPAAAGWQQNAHGWWYNDAQGNYVTGWKQINGYWYYFADNGYMQTGWQWIDGSCYYFYPSGYMATDTWIGDSYVNGSGVWVP